MKIKQVCEATGLTDRAIRYYIEEELVSPVYTENYMGRRAYDFTEEDVAALNHVATLRKFGFTVEEIRRILNDPQESIAVLEEVRARKEETLRQEGENLDALSRLEAEKAYTVAELAEKLEEPVREVEAPKEDGSLAWVDLFWRGFAALVMLIIAMVPVCAVVEGVVSGLRMYRHASVGISNVLSILVALVPTICMVILWWRKRRGRGHWWTRWLVIGLCLLYLPVSLFFGIGGAVGYSVTTDISDYRRFDADCLANRDSFLQDMLPTWPGNYEDAVYLYRDLPAWDYTYDIYAEWSLPQDKFDAEVTRMVQLFAERKPEHIVMDKGDYTLLMSLGHYGDIVPFEPVTDSYDIYIFAYDTEHCRVRYINCISLENGYDQPYYLEMDWGD